MRLKELREAKGLSQTQLANELGISQQAYARYEKGDRKPKISTLIKLADYFDVSVDYLIGHEKTSNHGTGQTFG